MSNRDLESESILKSFFEQMKAYVSDVLSQGSNCIEGLYSFYKKAWSLPKVYKGNSSQMGFIPEYLVFEAIKQRLEQKYQTEFKPILRRGTKEKPETFYFVDDETEPNRLIIQGLQIKKGEKAKLSLPQTSSAHDFSYLVRKDGWQIKLIVEVKGWFDSPSFKDDLRKLSEAQEKYDITSDCLFAFVGFRHAQDLEGSIKNNISDYVKRKNCFLILPGLNDSGVKKSTFEELFKVL